MTTRQTEFPALGFAPYEDAVQAYSGLLEQQAEALAARDALRGTNRVGVFPDGTPRYADGALTQAMHDDDVAQGVALRTGQPDPGRKRTAQVAKDLAKAEDRHRALEHAVTDARAAVQEVVRTQRDGMLEHARTQQAQATRDYADAVDALVEARREFFTRQTLTAWVENGGGRYKVLGVPGLVALAHLSQNAEPMAPEAVLSAFRDEATPPAPARKVVRWQPHRHQPRVNGVLVEDTLTATPVFADEPEAVPANQTGAGLHVGGTPFYPGTPAGGDDDE